MTTAQTPSLLPCPFCGGPVAMEEAYPTRSSMYGERRWWGVICRNTINRGGSCAIQQIPSASIDAAAERWNHRAPLEARKPLPVSDDARLRLRSDVARAIWDVMREHEDRCDHALEDVDHKHQVWDCADAAIRAMKDKP